MFSACLSLVQFGSAGGRKEGDMLIPPDCLAPGCEKEKEEGRHTFCSCLNGVSGMEGGRAVSSVVPLGAAPLKDDLKGGEVAN